MKNCLRKKFLIVFLTGLFVFAVSGEALAQAVVSDTQSTGKTVKQWFTEVKESKTVVGTMDTVKKTSSAIGTAKKSVSEYVLKNKQKIEAKIAKVKEYKEKAEKYKAEYDKYKKQLDENIAKAKELKEQAEAGIETAQDTVSAAREAAGGAMDAAGAAVDAAKDKAGLGEEEKAVETVSPSTSENENTAAAETAVSEIVPESSRKAFGTPGTAVVSPKVTETTVAPALKTGDETVSAVDARPTVVKSTAAPAADAVMQKAVTVPQVVPAEKTRLRKAFTTSSLHRGETLAFAKTEMLNLPDGGTDSNGTVIIPQSLAMFCGLSANDALSPGVLDECLLKLNKERQSAQLFSGSDAPKIFNRALAQYVAAGIAEAYKARQDAESFEENFIDAVDFASEPTAQDVYDNIVELNKAVDMEMNGLLKIFSTQLAAQALYNYHGYTFVPEENTEETGGGNG